MDITKGIRDSIDLYRQNVKVLLLATLVAAVGSMITFGILSGPLVGGLLMLCLKLIRGETAEVSEVFAHFDKFLPTFLIVIAMWAAMFIAMILGQIPIIGSLFLFVIGPAIGMVFILAIGYIVDQNYTPVNALQQALQCFLVNPVMIWLYSFAIGMLSTIGAILFGAGVILTMPIGTIGMAIAYWELSDRKISI